MINDSPSSSWNSFYGYYTGGEDYFTHITSNYYDFRNDSGPNCGGNCSQVAIDGYKHYSAQLFSDEAINVIKKYNETYGDDDDTPLFLYLAYQSVHSPNDVIPRYEEMYGGNSSNPNYIGNTDRRIFAGMVSCMDEGIGNITNALKKYGLFDDNLIVVFTSDNGGPIPYDNGGKLNKVHFDIFFLSFFSFVFFSFCFLSTVCSFGSLLLFYLFSS